MSDERYFLTTDEDGHWYVVPDSQRRTFESYVYEDGECPEGVLMVPGDPAAWVSFENPLVGQ